MSRENVSIMEELKGAKKRVLPKKFNSMRFITSLKSTKGDKSMMIFEHKNIMKDAVKEAKFFTREHNDDKELYYTFLFSSLNTTIKHLCDVINAKEEEESDLEEESNNIDLEWLREELKIIRVKLNSYMPVVQTEPVIFKVPPGKTEVQGGSVIKFGDVRCFDTDCTYYCDLEDNNCLDKRDVTECLEVVLTPNSGIIDTFDEGSKCHDEACSDFDYSMDNNCISKINITKCKRLTKP